MKKTRIKGSIAFTAFAGTTCRTTVYYKMTNEAKLEGDPTRIKTRQKVRMVGQRARTVLNVCVSCRFKAT